MAEPIDAADAETTRRARGGPGQAAAHGERRCWPPKTLPLGGCGWREAARHRAELRPGELVSALSV